MLSSIKRAPWGQWACFVGAILPLNFIEETGSVAAAICVAAFAISGALLRVGQIWRERPTARQGLEK